MSRTTVTREFDSDALKGKVTVTFPTGLFIDGKFSAGKGGNTIE